MSNIIPLKNTLTVDPGWNTGLAYWTGDMYPVTSIIREPVRIKKIKIETVRLAFMFQRFSAFIRVYEENLDNVYIEGAQLWINSIKSMAAAQRGNLFALSYIIGGYASICISKGISVDLRYPSGKITEHRQIWKGQLGSKQLAKRIHRLNGKTYPEHVREAVGIGFSIMEVL